MKYREMTKNYIFRELECGLSVKETSELCFKSVRTVKEWDKGKEIPKECRRLMRWCSGRELSKHEDWEQFKMCNEYMLLPTGRSVTAQQVLAGVALLEIQAELDVKTTAKLLRYARAIARIKRRSPKNTNIE